MDKTIGTIHFPPSRLQEMNPSNPSILSTMRIVILCLVVILIGHASAVCPFELLLRSGRLDSETGQIQCTQKRPELQKPIKKNKNIQQLGFAGGHPPNY